MVHEADKAMLKIEGARLMPHATWTDGIDTKGADIPGFYAMEAHTAEAFFWTKYHELEKLIQDAKASVRA